MAMRLQLENIEKSYSSVKALEDISLEITGGKATALLGINGAGKTTLLRILAGLEKQDNGRIFFNGKRTNRRQLRQIATLVFQRTAMFNRSVYDNLAYGLKIREKKDDEIREEISRALQAVGLRNFERRKAKKTSGGEQQRIALARAFLLNPLILLLDEPTANLDANSAAIVERAIVDRTRGKGIVIISTHNLSQAKRMANQVVHIYGGKIVEVANSEDFFSNPSSEISRKFISGELDY
jgi:tungstate transport system ATP-binding protein